MRPARSFRLTRSGLRWAALVLALFLGLGRPAGAGDLPWTMLTPANDTRDAEMRRWDEGDSLNFVGLMNANEKIAGGRFVWSKSAVRDVLAAKTPFAELRFDATKPMDFTPEEKKALKEWLKRGGFLLLFEDAYPYEEEEFRKQATLPVFEYLAKTLPAEDPDFTIVKADDSHPIFHTIYPTQTVPSIRREMEQNPHYRGRTMLFYRGKFAAFFMGRYSHEENGRFVPMPRPLLHTYSFDPRSYYLILNLYVYAMTQ